MVSALKLARIAPPNLRAAPAELTPELAGRFVTLAELICNDRTGGGQSLPPRAIDGSYPFRTHRTVAEIWAEGAE